MHWVNSNGCLGLSWGGCESCLQDLSCLDQNVTLDCTLLSRHDKTTQYNTWQDAIENKRHGEAIHDKTWYGRTKQDKPGQTRHDSIGQDKAGHGKKGQDKTKQDMTLVGLREGGCSKFGREGGGVYPSPCPFRWYLTLALKESEVLIILSRGETEKEKEEKMHKQNQGNTRNWTHQT